jgi:hypothetical protein
MGFLIRMAFWFSLVLLFIPFEVSDGDGRVDTVGPIQAFFAAKGAVDDIAGMCERKPDVCETGRSALQTIGLKARETARMAYAWIEDDARQVERPAREVADSEIMTGSIEAPVESAERLELAARSD